MDDPGDELHTAGAGALDSVEELDAESGRVVPDDEVFEGGAGRRPSATAARDAVLNAVQSQIDRLFWRTFSAGQQRQRGGGNKG